MTTHCIVAATLYNPTFMQRIAFMKCMLASGLKKNPFSNVFTFEVEGNTDCVGWLRLTTRRAASAANISYLTFVVQAGNTPVSFHEHPPTKA